MTYIEPFVLQNLLLCYCIGVTSYRFLRVRKSNARLLLCAFVASAAALFAPFFSAPVVVAVAVKILLGMLLVCILFWRKYSYIKGVLSFIAATFLWGGAMFAVYGLRYGSVAAAFTDPIRPVWSLCIAAAIVLYNVVCGAITVFNRRADVAARLYRYRCELGGRVYEGTGFLDTGNLLYDRKSGLPVVVLSMRTILPDLTDAQAKDVFCGHVERVFAGARRMPCGSVGGKSDMWVVEPEKFYVYCGADKNIVVDVSVGLSLCLGCGEYDALLHPAMERALLA